MALNLKTFATRTMSAAVFVVLLLGSVWLNYITFSFFFFLVTLGCLHEAFNLAEVSGLKLFRGAGMVCGCMLFLSFVAWGVLFPSLRLFHFVGFVVMVPGILLACMVFSRCENAVVTALLTLAAVIYAAFPFAAMHLLVVDFTYGYEPHALLGIIFLIWLNDTFAYIIGALIGRHKMIERVSPGKTWEGTAGGVIVAFAASFLFPQLLGGSTIHWMTMGMIVPVLATIGDLVESQLKRRAGVKDSGHIMPGHGGFLDRFDSLLFVTPFAVGINFLL